MEAGGAEVLRTEGWRNSGRRKKREQFKRRMILDVVDVYDYYTRERERLDIPQSYWWWYLDELEAEELPEWVTDARAISSEHGSVVQRWSRVKHLRMLALGVMHQQARYCGSNWR